MTTRKRTAIGALGPLGLALVVVSMGPVQVQVTPGFGQPLAGLTADELDRFEAGRDAFEEEEDVFDGLGPVFNGASCVECHDTGGTGGGSTRRETRFGLLQGGVFDPLEGLGGSLIQSNGIGPFNGVDFVGEVVPPAANVVARRRSTPLFGLGLVDAVPDDTFFALARHQQARSPAIAGRVHVVIDVASGEPRVGRFGWKDQVATLATFAGDAYVFEMGVTTPMFPDEQCPQGDCGLLAANPAPDMPNDATNETLVEFADFMTLLAPPPRAADTGLVRAGEALFGNIGCADCHTPTLTTGPSDVAALDHVEFHPFSDFLLHDMGVLGDGIVQGEATGRLMRTAPLWGSRLFETFLHDGRAASAVEAIQFHDGQGAASRARFNALSPPNRAKVEAFLRSL